MALLQDLCFVQYLFYYLRPKFLKKPFEVVHSYQNWRLRPAALLEMDSFLGLFHGKFLLTWKIYQTATFMTITSNFLIRYFLEVLVPKLCLKLCALLINTLEKVHLITLEASESTTPATGKIEF